MALRGGADWNHDAIERVNDKIATGGLVGVRAAVVTVPDDLAVIGWDHVPAARHRTEPLHELLPTGLGRSLELRVQLRHKGGVEE